MQLYFNQCSVKVGFIHVGVCVPACVCLFVLVLGLLWYNFVGQCVCLYLCI